MTNIGTIQVESGVNRHHWQYRWGDLVGKAELFDELAEVLRSRSEWQ